MLVHDAVMSSARSHAWIDVQPSARPIDAASAAN
jgi:hypothetical protein